MTKFATRSPKACALAVAALILPLLPAGAYAQALTPEQKAKIEAARKKAEQQKKAVPQQNAAPANKKGPPPGVTAKRPPANAVRKPVPPARPTVTAPAVVKPVNKPAIVNTPPAVKPPVVSKPAVTRPPVVAQPPPVQRTQPSTATGSRSIDANTSTSERWRRYRSRDRDRQRTDGTFTRRDRDRDRIDRPTTTTPVIDPDTRRPAIVPGDLRTIKEQRKEVVSKRANAVVIKEPDNRIIVKRNNRAVIVKDDSARLKRVGRDVQVQKDGKNDVTIINRPNNVQIVNVTDGSGQLVRRYRKDRDGREHDIIDNRARKKKSRWRRNLAIGLGVGAGVIAGAAILNAVADVPPPRVDVPRRKYIVDYDDAGEDDVYEAFSAPPVDRVERRYTLDEVRATPHLRDRMRRVDLNDITFDTGSWEVSEGEFRKLDRVARAMMRVIERNPNEVFMIEGYTDAVGSEDDNLTLSDRRAESVAVILSEEFQVPPENLTTQGYGEQYLKIDTSGPERANRRVAVRRITPLISQDERRD